MKKRLLAVIAIFTLAMPLTLHAISVNAPEDFVPGKQMLTMDVQLTSKLKNALEPILNMMLEETDGTSADDLKGRTLLNKLINGDRIFVSLSPTKEDSSPMDSLVLSFPVTDDEWKIFTAGSEKTTYNSVDVYVGGVGDVGDFTYIANIGGFAVVTSTEKGINGMVDLAVGSTTNSLGNDADYKGFTSSYFAPHLLSGTLDWQSLMNLLKEMVPDITSDTEIKAIFELLEIFKMAGGSLTETPNGYKFNFKFHGDADKLKAKGLSMNPMGNFKPSLLGKLPNAKPIFYSEGFNAKAGYAQEKKILQDLATATGNPAADISAFLKQTANIDLDSIYNVLDQEFAVAIQYNNNSPIPYLTLMANVSNTKADATKLMTDLSDTVTKLLKDADAPQDVVKKTTEGGFTKLSVDLTKIPDYDGPSLPKIIVTFGISDDGLMMISNYPDIDQASKRTGIASNPDLAAYNIAGLGSITSVVYLNVRNIWDCVDSFAEWTQRTDGGKFAMPLDFYQGYYSVLEKIYGWKDLFLVSNDSETESLLTGTLAIDNATHKTYSEFMGSTKTSDKDGDGVSDYEELYIYNTPVDTADSNGNGISDVDELKKGMNPNGPGKLFKDVPSDGYYTADTAFLYQRRAVSGYPDGTFQPGRLVNRAEFIAMVVKSFESSASSVFNLGVKLDSGYVPFDDVPGGAWFYEPISKAYAAGWISGSYDDRADAWYFRPGDNITRAEAIAILNKASKALTKTRPHAVCSASGFKDVPRDAWFCDAVANAASQGITKGKAPGAFKPFDQLTRAEAAVMISRTIEKDLAQEGAGTMSTEEMAAPIMDLLH